MAFDSSWYNPSPTIAPTVNAPKVGNSSSLQSILDILGSKGGQTAVGAIGAGLQAYQSSKDRAQDRAMQEAGQKQNAAQFAANTFQRQTEDDRAHQMDQSKSVASLSPIGESQLFAQRNAVIAPLLKGARNFSVTPGDPAIAAAMGSGPQGGIQLPSGGLDLNMIDRLFGDAATLESIKSRQSNLGAINPNIKTMDLGPIFGDAGAQASNGLAADNAAQAEAEALKLAQQRDLIMRALDEDIKGENRGPAPEGYEYDKETGELKKKGSSIWKKIGKGALIGGAALATAMTGGAASPALIAAIGAGSGAALGAMDGGGWKGALTGAALGGVTGGLGGGAGAGAAKLGLGAAAKQVAKNPALYSAILGR